jgi:dienelactone hydrolase
MDFNTPEAMRLTVVFLMALAVSCTYLVDPPLDHTYTNTVYETPDYVRITTPGKTTFTTGFFYYPGALVDPSAYLTWLDSLVTADTGLMVVLVKMPANLAVFNPDKALQLKNELPKAERWIIGGHSLGGTMACKATSDHPDEFQGVVLLGSYPDDKDDLSAWPNPVLSLSAEFDGLATPSDIQNAEKYLPPAYRMTSPTDVPAPLGAQTCYYQIPGGNHAQFGNYGKQDGDGEAAITPGEQHRIVIEAISQFISNL